MLPEIGCGLRDFAYAIAYIYADLCHCPWLVPFKFHLEAVVSAPPARPAVRYFDTVVPVILSCVSLKRG